MLRRELRPILRHAVKVLWVTDGAEPRAVASRELVLPKDAAKSIAYCGQVFGATEKFRLVDPSGRIGHAQFDFSGATLMVSDELPELGIGAPQPTDMRQPFATIRSSARSSGGPSSLSFHWDAVAPTIRAAAHAAPEQVSIPDLPPSVPS